MDARMGEVYWGVFENAEALPAVTGWSEAVTPPAALPQGLRGTLIRAAGRGLAGHPALPGWLGLPGACCLPEAEPHALDIAYLAAGDIGSGASWQDAAAAQPVYLRDQVAQMSG
jgi:tRNA A37 threonylcarbamoyladenosine modification protein TsaB